VSEDRRLEIGQDGSRKQLPRGLPIASVSHRRVPTTNEAPLDATTVNRHDETCACIRCIGFEPGNGIAARHGAYARLQLSEKAGETADVLRELVPVYQESDEPLLQAFGYVLEQLRASAGALERAEGRKEQLRLSQDARGWTLAALRYAEHFAMTPRARTALGLDLVRGEATRLTVTRLARLAEEES
jgi:hypothetical protein